MGCLLSCIPHCINCGDKQKRQKIRGIADNRRQNILPVIRQFIFADLDTCVRDVRLNLASAQAMVILSRYDPFSRMKMEEFRALVANLKQEEDLRQLRREIEGSLQSTEWWLNICNSGSIVAIVSAIVVSIVLAALVKVHVAVAAGATAGTLIKTVEQWFRSNWEQQKDALKGEKEEVEKMQAPLLVVSSYLETLLCLVQKVKSDYATLAAYMEYFLNQEICKDYQEEAVKTKINELKASMNLLTSTAVKCIQKILQAEAELSLINYNA